MGKVYTSFQKQSIYLLVPVKYIPFPWQVTLKRNTMTAEQFFYLVKQMRQAQREYFAHREQAKLRACRALEGDVDREILRVMDILKEKEGGA